MTIRPMQPDDAAQAAALHAHALPDDFLSRLGQGFLGGVYYPFVLGAPDGVGLCARGADSALAGYVIAAGAGMTGRVAGAHPLALCAAVGRNPALWGHALDVARVMLLPGAPPMGKDDAELLYIAVAEGQRSHGLGSRLVTGLCQRLAAAGYARCFVKTLAATPRTNSFYAANGFVLAAASRGRNWYVRGL